MKERMKEGRKDEKKKKFHYLSAVLKPKIMEKWTNSSNHHHVPKYNANELFVDEFDSSKTNALVIKW